MWAIRERAFASCLLLFLVLASANCASTIARVQAVASAPVGKPTAAAPDRNNTEAPSLTKDEVRSGPGPGIQVVPRAADEGLDPVVSKRVASICATLKAVDPSLSKDDRTQERVIDILLDHPGWSDAEISWIVRGTIRIGMSAEQVLASWGRPRDINRSVYSFGVHEQWVYSPHQNRYVYLEDGIVTSWSD